MKKISLLLTICMFAVTLSCKKETNKTKEATEKETSTTENYVVKPEGTKVTWTAYKTTDKVGVNGEFTTVKFENKSGASPQEALNQLQFSIPISSLFTNDATNTRDDKIKTSFFGSMLDPDVISGTIRVEDQNYIASIKMNGVTQDLPLDVTITDQRRVTLEGTMNLKDWNAIEALNALNKVCFDLHKGADGVSKTWEDVAVKVEIYLRKK